MADGVAITAGSGTTISTDDCSAAGHVQRIKVAYGADGDATQVGADANGLDVDVVRLPSLPAGANVVGGVTLPGGLTGFAEDAAHTSGDVGLLALAVRKDAATQLAGTDGDYSPLINDASGRLHVNVGNATLAVTQSGTWNVTNVSGTVSLPTGASTAAKQPALGTAGSASADVITIQGVASMTAVKVDGSAVTQPVSGTVGVSGTVTVDSELTTADLDTGAGTDTRAVVGLAYAASGGAVLVSVANPYPVSVQGTATVSGTITANIGTTGTLALDASVAALQVAQGSTTSGQKGGLALGSVTTAAPTYTTAQTSPLSLTTAGALRVDASATTQPVSGTVTVNAGTNLNTSLLALESGGNLATLAGAVTSAKVQANVAQFAGTAADTNSGSKSAGTLRVVLATDQPQLTASLKVDPSGVTSPVSLASLPALAAGTAVVGVAVSPQQTGAVYSGTTALTPKFAAIAASSSGASTLVALVSSKKLRVLSVALVANAAVNVKFQSHVTPTDITGLFYLAANGGFVLPFSPAGHFETVSGEALDINLSGAVAVGGVVTYIEV
jgi:hypothetical protein